MTRLLGLGLHPSREGLPDLPSGHAPALGGSPGRLAGDPGHAARAQERHQLWCHHPAGTFLKVKTLRSAPVSGNNIRKAAHAKADQVRMTRDVSVSQGDVS